MVAAFHAMRVVGLPGLELWQLLLPHCPRMRFLEDNQAMLQCVRSGRNPTMRHLSRTHRVSVAWMHEQYKSDNFTFAHESGERPAVALLRFREGAESVCLRQRGNTLVVKCLMLACIKSLEARVGLLLMRWIAKRAAACVIFETSAGT